MKRSGEVMGGLRIPILGKILVLLLPMVVLPLLILGAIGTRRGMESLERMAEVNLEEDPDMALAYVADDQGICIVSTSPNMVGRDYKATREYMRRALAGEHYISDLAMGVTTREPGVFLAGPVRGADGAQVEQMVRDFAFADAEELLGKPSN